MRDARVAVVGLGTSGRAAAEVLLTLGARPAGFDAREEAAEAARADGIEARAVADPAALAEAVLAAGPDLVVVSPGVPSHAPLYRLASAAGIPVWSEVELAWQVQAPRADGSFAPWLTLTGTNGKTTTVTMASEILQAAGLDAPAVGNVGTPIVRVAAQGAVDVMAVELSSFQLHATFSVEPLASACLNVAPDHIDWHGSLEAYIADKARVYDRTLLACAYNLADPVTRRMVDGASPAPGARIVGVGLGAPAAGELGVHDGVLTDRAFVSPPGEAVLATVDDLAHLAPGGAGTIPGHILADALFAAALTRAYGVSPAAVRDGLRAHQPGAHRIALVRTVGGVRWVDDSKATNAHAAAASLLALPPGSVVWMAGGLAKGARFDDLVEHVRDRLRGVVLIGVDREPMRSALERHAPEVPRFEVVVADHGEVMRQAVAAALRLARPGDTVLMAPACASMDQFVSYAHRGDAFTRAVEELGSE